MTERNRGNEQPPPPRSRLEDEVREILVRADQPTSLADHVRRKGQRRRAPVRAGTTGSLPGLGQIGPGTLLAAGFAVAFLAMLVRPSSPLLATLLAVGSVVLLALLWVPRYGGSGRSNVKQWRGRDIDLSPPPPAWVESLRERFRRPPRL